jgi:hypothetical protein
MLYACVVVRVAFKKVLGLLCLVLGLLALVTPMTPGAWLALVGMELLGLSFLLPKPLRLHWEGLKERLSKRFHDTYQRVRRRLGLS